MPFLNTNSAFLEIDGVDLSPYWGGELGYDVTNDTQETTGGSGVTWRDFEPGLSSWEASIELGWDKTQYQTYLDLTEAGGELSIVYGPLGNTVGLPKFEGNFLTTKTSVVKQSVDKQKLMNKIDIKGKEEPTSLIERGDTF